MNPADRLTPEQAAPLLSHSEETVRRWCRRRELNSVKIGRKVFVTGAEISRFLEHGPAVRPTRKPRSARAPMGSRGPVPAGARKARKPVRVGVSRRMEPVSKA